MYYSEEDNESLHSPTSVMRHEQEQYPWKPPRCCWRHKITAVSPAAVTDFFFFTNRHPIVSHISQGSETISDCINVANSCTTNYCDHRYKILIEPEFMVLAVRLGIRDNCVLFQNVWFCCSKGSHLKYLLKLMGLWGTVLDVGDVNNDGNNNIDNDDTNTTIAPGITFSYAIKLYIYQLIHHYRISLKKKMLLQ